LGMQLGDGSMQSVRVAAFTDPPGPVERSGKVSVGDRICTVAGEDVRSLDTDAVLERVCGATRPITIGFSSTRAADAAPHLGTRVEHRQWEEPGDARGCEHPTIFSEFPAPDGVPDRDLGSVPPLPPVAEGAGTEARWAELVGCDGGAAAAAIRAQCAELAMVQVIPSDAMVTMDFRTDRVRVFVDAEGRVVRPPIRG
jgi:hypothetical protein